MILINCQFSQFLSELSNLLFWPSKPRLFFFLFLFYLFVIFFIFSVKLYLFVIFSVVFFMLNHEDKYTYRLHELPGSAEDLRAFLQTLRSGMGSAS